MDSVFLALLFVASTALASQISGPFVVGDPDYEWKACKQLPILNQTCVEIFAEKQKLLLGLRLIVNNRTMFEKDVSADHICMSQDELLKLLEYIPALAPYKPLIDEILKLHRFIPADVFSVCIHLKDLVISKTEFKGCVDLDVKLICWAGKCLWKGSEPLGCFDIKKYPY